MRRMTYLVMALALVLGFTQCKKEQPTPQSQGVRITLNVNGGNSNSRVDVDPTGHTNPDYATVSFETGDVIYVGYNNQYVGTLTYGDGMFDGTVNISETVEGEHLHFYFLGGVGFTPTVDGNTATVVISDQTEKYPVISYAPSNEEYSSGFSSYTAKLMNKCSIMKFMVADGTPSTAAICITGMNNKVTVDFTSPSGTDNGFTFGMDGEGLIKMPAKDADNVSWAIVLPQEALDAGSFGTAYTEDAVESNCYLGSRPSIPVIGSNEYIVSGVGTMTMTDKKYVDLSIQNSNFAAKNGQVLYGATNKYVYTDSPGATVTLRNVTIHAGIKCRTTCTLVLEGVNTVDQTMSQTSAIHVKVGCTLTIKGSGRLDATGGDYGAGIGASDQDRDCGNIVIEGGIIYATGGNQGCAGIGGMYLADYPCGNITISGGEVHATGGGGTYHKGAGIGCGETGKCGNITITGGTVHASGTSGAAGIGTANANGECGNITITGGTVVATGGLSAAGIGTGAGGTCGSITITNDNGNTHVTAYKGTNTAAKNSIGIGGTKTGYALGTVTIGGTVYYNGSAYQNEGNTYLAQRPLVYPQQP